MHLLSIVNETPFSALRYTVTVCIISYYTLLSLSLSLEMDKQEERREEAKKGLDTEKKRIRLYSATSIRIRDDSSYSGSLHVLMHL